MNNATLFKKAHEMARKTVKSGDNYQVTFSLCLKVLISEQSVKITTYNSDKSVTVTYQPKKQVNKHCAMVGDYIKPADRNNDSLDFKNMLVAAVSILIIFTMSLYTIINL